MVVLDIHKTIFTLIIVNVKINVRSCHSYHFIAIYKLLGC